MKNDFGMWFSQNCSLSNYAVLFTQFGRNFKNEEMAAILNFKILKLKKMISGFVLMLI